MLLEDWLRNNLQLYQGIDFYISPFADLLRVKGFGSNITTVFCKFLLLKRFILNIAISNVIIKCHWRNMFYGRYTWE